MMFKVLQVVPNLSVKSGASSFLMNLYRNIDRSEIQFDFLVTKKTEPSYQIEIEALGGRVFYAPNPLSLSFFSTIKYLRGFFSKNSKDYSVVHIHSPNLIMFVAPFARGAKIRKVIAHSHSSKFSASKIKQLIDQLLVFGIKKFITDFWACSPEAGQFLFGKNSSFVLIKNAIDPEPFKFDVEARDYVRKELNIEGKKVICHVSNFNRLKNTFFLTDVINLVAQSSDEFVFLFVGEGSDKQELVKRLAKLRMLKKCIFVGFQSKVAKYLNASDALVLPSIKEGAPVILIEAQSNGLPCFVSNSVTRYVNMGLCEYLPLKTNVWISKILMFKKSTNSERCKAINRIKSSDYSVENTARFVTNLYKQRE